MTKVLLVDDIALNLMIVQKMLASLPLQITKATNGQQAIEAIEHDQPDLILLDLMMPVMDGFEVLKRIRGGEAGNPKCPVIIVSALNNDADITRGMSLGANDFITKPLLLERILRAVKPYAPGA